METTIVNTQVERTDGADEGFILMSELRDGDGELRVPLHPNHIRKLIKRGEFPRPYDVGGRNAFRRREIRQWSRSRQQVTGSGKQVPNAQQGA